MRSGEQAALGMDLLELLDALKMRQAIREWLTRNILC
jgi:hypothetical protein